MAADRQQPVPWVLLVSTRGCSSTRASRPGAKSQSATRPAAMASSSKCPPLMSTAPAPMSMSLAAASSMLARSMISMPARSSASGRLGVRRSARGSMRVRRASTASSCNSLCPLWLTHTGSTTRGKALSARPSATASMMPAENSMPVLAAATSKSSSTVDSCNPTKPGVGASMPVTPREFCAVSAVMTDMPKPPSMAMVFRSAWMPAPPPESEPAMVRMVDGVFMPCSNSL